MDTLEKLQYAVDTEALGEDGAGWLALSCTTQELDGLANSGAVMLDTPQSVIHDAQRIKRVTA